ncbi:hypothetical protein [Escherichia coli]|uniref:hypothetical protein n=1 Tax=Escherichia coli TaxID=562 RepID=UPI001BFD6994|nr:hypothetical protein [Escherichia coli]
MFTSYRQLSGGVQLVAEPDLRGFIRPGDALRYGKLIFQHTNRRLLLIGDPVRLFKGAG